MNQVCMNTAYLWSFGAGFLFACALAGMVLWILSLKRKVAQPSPAVRLSFIIGGKKETQMNLKASQQVTISVEADDKFGNSGAALDAPPVWSMTDPSLGVLSPAADGMSALLVPSGKLGACQVQAAAKADGKDVLGSLDMSIVAGDAVALALSGGQAVDVPAAPAPVADPAAPVSG